jgi:hypothetical protein
MSDLLLLPLVAILCPPPLLSENVSHYSLDLYPYSAIIPEMSISETLISLHYLVCPCQEDITHPLDHSLEMAAPPNA